jgi:protein MYSM1
MVAKLYFFTQHYLIVIRKKISPFKVFKNKIKAIQKRRAQALAREKKQRPKKIKTVIHPPVSNKNASSQQILSKKSHHQQHHTPAARKPEVLEYIQYKPKPSVDPKNSGEILRMEKVESDDIEVDILSNSEDDDMDIVEVPDLNILPDEDDDESGELSVDDPDSSFTTETMPIEQEEETLQKLNELKEYDEQTYNRLESTEGPSSELVLEPTNITSVEKFMMSEFFTASPTKTPERYLKIRNHIISMWMQCRPSYLSKTASRAGLKKCGDVNSISRVHHLLENIGAINFDCYEVKYILPLKVLYGAFQQSIRNKNQSFTRSKYDSNSDNSVANVDSSSDSMINRIKSRTQSRTQFELIKCQRYSKDNLAPFEISITLSCLLCLYFHALSSKLEIMGFLGGHVDKSNGRNKINLKCYKPCRTSTQTAISAEMCPVSQVEQSNDLTESGYELLGWFHR